MVIGAAWLRFGFEAPAVVLLRNSAQQVEQLRTRAPRQLPKQVQSQMHRDCCFSEASSELWPQAFELWPGTALAMRLQKDLSYKPESDLPLPGSLVASRLRPVGCCNDPPAVRRKPIASAAAPERSASP